MSEWLSKTREQKDAHNAWKRRRRDRSGEYWPQIRYKYGLSKEDYLAMLIAQDGRCAVCRIVVTRPCVDHDHETGAVRGLLCRLCNAGIGSLGDDPERLLVAAAYLRRAS